jgi:BON domain-containing protein
MRVWPVCGNLYKYYPVEVSMVGDLELRQDVFDELEFEPSVNAAHIGVTANKGVVTLTGFVTSYAEKALGQARQLSPPAISQCVISSGIGA